MTFEKCPNCLCSQPVTAENCGVCGIKLTQTRPRLKRVLPAFLIGSLFGVVVGGAVVEYSKSERDPAHVANSAVTTADEAARVAPMATIESAAPAKAEPIATGTKTPKNVPPPTNVNAVTPAPMPTEASREPASVARSYDDGEQEGIRIEGGYLMGFSVVKNGNTICEDPFFWEATKEIECD